MKAFKRTVMPDSITHNNRIYKLDVEKSHLFNNGKDFDETGCIILELHNRRLKGKTDLHGKAYQNSYWIYKAEPLYKVFKVWRKSGRRQILEKGLTLEAAKKIVDNFNNSQTTKVCFEKY